MKFFFSALCALLLTAATARAAPLTLRVVDADNKPVANATVSYVDYADWNAEQQTVNAMQEARATPDGTLALDLRGGTTTIDADGYVTRAAPAQALGAARVKAPGFGFKNVLLIAGENRVTLGLAAQLSGIVRDEKGAPIVGAQIELIKVERGEYEQKDRVASAGLADVITQTGTDGAWKFEEISRGYAALSVSAPDKVTEEFDILLDSAQKVAPPLELQAAGEVRGRIVDAQGRGVAGVEVESNNQVEDDMRSDSEGNFHLTKVPPGENNLLFWSASADWLGVDDSLSVNVTAGAVADAGEVRAGTGVLVAGRLIDLAGAPLANFPLQVGATKLRTGANGRFEGHVKKDSDFAKFPADYVMVTNAPSIADGAKEFDAGDVTVARGATLPLDLRDENGRAVPQATVYFDSKMARGNAVFDGANAVSSPMLAGDYEIKGRYLWEVIEPKTVSVHLPANGEKIAPLRVVVRELAPTQVSGRVVDERGNGLAGASVTVFLSEAGQRNVTSASDGTWKIEPDTHGEPFFMSPVKLENYTQLRGGEWTHQDADEFDSWKAADIVMSQLDATVAGHVVGEAGQNVAGARVSWGDEPIFQSVATDNSGNFKIEGLPDAPITVYASDGPSYAQAAATPGVPIELKLPAAAKLSDEELEKQWETVSAGEVPRLWPYFEILGAPRIFEATKRFDAKRDPTEIGGLYNYLDILAQRAITPAQRADAASQGVALLRRFPIAQTGGLGAARIAILAARSDDAEVRAWADSWYDAQKPHQSLDRTHPYYVGETLRVATVGAILGREDASDYLSIGLTLAGRVPNADANYYLADWGAIVSDGGPQWFEEAASIWSPTQQMSAIAGALQSVTDVKRARELLAQLEKLGDDPEVLAAEAQELKQRPDNITKRQSLLEQGRFQFVTRVARLDAAAALEELEAHGAEADANAMAFAVARAAIESGQTEIARRALKLGSGVSLAALAQQIDPQLARKMLDEVFQSANVESTYAPGDGLHRIAPYALAVRDINGGQGRLMLEEQWRRQQAIGGNYAQSWQHFEDMHDLAWAMSLYDVPRALQWLGEIKDTRPDAAQRADQTRIAILVMALAAPQQRALALEIGRAN